MSYAKQLQEINLQQTAKLPYTAQTMKTGPGSLHTSATNAGLGKDSSDLNPTSTST